MRSWITIRSAGPGALFTGMALTLGIVLVAGGCASKRPNVAVTPQMEELAGSWTFNPADSDDSATVAEKLRESMRGGAPGGRGEPPGGFGGRGGRAGGGFGGGRRGGRRPGGEEGGRREAGARGMMGSVLRAPQALTISVGDSTVTVDDHLGMVRTLPTNGHGVTQEIGPNTSIKLKARWEGQHLIVSRETRDRMKVTEEYLVEPTEHRLHVVVELVPPQGRRVTFLRIYDHS